MAKEKFWSAIRLKKDLVSVTHKMLSLKDARDKRFQCHFIYCSLRISVRRGITQGMDIGTLIKNSYKERKKATHNIAK